MNHLHYETVVRLQSVGRKIQWTQGPELAYTVRVHT